MKDFELAIESPDKVKITHNINSLINVSIKNWRWEVFKWGRPLQFVLLTIRLIIYAFIPGLLHQQYNFFQITVNEENLQQAFCTCLKFQKCKLMRCLISSFLTEIGIY